MTSSRADVAAYLAMVRGHDGPSLIDLDPRTARAQARAAGPAVERPARPMPRQDVSVPGRGGHAIPARLYHPGEPGRAGPLVLFFHGGGWVLGDIDGYDALASEIAFQLGMTLLSIDYRLAPEHPFPAAVEDAIDAARWAAAGPAAIGHAVSGLVLAGDSAGGALAVVVARELVDEAPVPLRAQWLIYPVADLSRDYPSDDELAPLFGLTPASRDRFYAHYLGGDALAERVRHPHVSPLLGERWAGLPPAVVMTCTFDPLRDQGRALAARFAAEGIATIFHEAEQVHGSFTMRRLLPSAQADLVRGAAAVRLLLADDADPAAAEGSAA